MLKRLLLAAAALAVSAPALADRGHSNGGWNKRGGHAHGHGHIKKDVVRHHSYYQNFPQRHHYHGHAPVVVMPPPRVYYAPPPRVYYAPPAPVYHYPAAPYGGVSIRFNIPF
ncbi:MAG TPA: hypothetical protein VFC18_13980 [Burkholderiales bacterium]|nr:hypothetical protein [Burkholderiales bacterium]